MRVGRGPRLASPIGSRGCPPSSHPSITTSLRNLAFCHEALGNADLAAQLRARAQALQAQRQAKGLDGQRQPPRPHGPFP